MAKDLYHQLVRDALEKDGWTITHDPYVIRKKHLGTKLEIDLGLEKVITAEKGVEKIAVEVKSFLEDSLIHEFHAVVGQYLHYIIGLSIIDVERILYLAMPHDVYLDLEKIELFNLSIEKFSVKILTFDTQTANIISWKK
jgi:hypothetical protein